MDSARAEDAEEQSQSPKSQRWQPDPLDALAEAVAAGFVIPSRFLSKEATSRRATWSRDLPPQKVRSFNELRTDEGNDCALPFDDPRKEGAATPPLDSHSGRILAWIPRSMDRGNPG